MKESALKELYTEAVKIVRAERRMRQAVLFNSPKLTEKLAEMDRLEEIITTIKDVAKPHTEPDIEQATLIDVPISPSFFDSNSRKKE